MNHKLKVLGVVLLIGGLLAASYFMSYDKEPKQSSDSENPNVIYENAQKESAAIKSQEKKDFAEISVSDYLEKYKESKYSVILISREGCSYCQIVIPILQKISKEYNIEMYDLSTTTFTEEDKENFLSSDERFQSSFGTPFLMIVGNNQIKDTEEGVTDYNHYVKFLSENKIIEG